MKRLRKMPTGRQRSAGQGGSVHNGQKLARERHERSCMRGLCMLAITSLMLGLVGCGGSGGGDGNLPGVTTGTTTTTTGPGTTTTGPGTTSGVTGTRGVTAADVSISTDNGPLFGDPPDALGGVYDFGLVVPPNTATTTFTLTNTSSQTMDFVANPTFVVIDQPSGGFTFTDVGGSIGPGGSTSFTVTYTPVTVARVSATVSIEIEGFGNVEWVLTAGLRDEPYILGNGLPIENGDDTPRPEDNTDFGSWNVLGAESATHLFQINNHQDVAIENMELSLITNPTGAFSIASPPTQNTLSPRASTEYRLTFTAVGRGPHEAVVQLRYFQEGQEFTYTYTITGIGLAPAIEIVAVLETVDTFTGLPVEIAEVPIDDLTQNEDPPTNTPSTQDNTDYGAFPLGITRTMRYRIRNTGNAPLDITNNPVVNAVGRNYDQWRLEEAPDSTILPGEASEFKMEFSNKFVSRLDTNYPSLLEPGNDTTDLPTAGDANGQLMTAIIRVDTNVPDNNHRPYWFNIQGTRLRTALTVQADPGVTDPDDEYRTGSLSTYGNDNLPLGHTIPHGQQRPQLRNRSDFGSVLVGGERTYRYHVRNDSAAAVALTGVPFVNVQGTHAEDYNVELVEVIRADSTVIPWASFPQNPPVLGPEDTLIMAITFEPSNLDLRQARIEIATDDPVAGVYRFAVHGRGQGPRIAVSDPQGATIERGDNIPSLDDSTVLQPPVYIADWATPSAVTMTYTITNNGNVGLELGDFTSGARVVSLSGDDTADFAVTRQPYNADGTIATFLEPGEQAFFDVTFSPTYNPQDIEAPRQHPLGINMGQQPEESERFINVIINSSDPGIIDAPDEEDDPEPEAFTFVLRGTAIDPKMEVRGNGKVISDLDYSPREIDQTVYHHVDMWGGALEHTFIIRNYGELWPLQLQQPSFDNEEKINSIPGYVTGPNTIWIPGFMHPSVGFEVLSPPLPVDASVLTRLRVGDEANGMQITAINPDMGLAMSLIENFGIYHFGLPGGANPGINVIGPGNLGPPEEHGPGGVLPFLRQNPYFPLGWQKTLPTVGSITVNGNLTLNDSTGDDFFLVEIQDQVMTINPAYTGGGISPGDLVFVGGTGYLVQGGGGVPGDLTIEIFDETRWPAVGNAPRFNATDYLARVDIPASGQGEHSLIFVNNRAVRQQLSRLLPNSRIVHTDNNNVETILTVTSVSVDDGTVFVQQNLTGIKNGFDANPANWIANHTLQIIAPIPFSVRSPVGVSFIKHDWQILNTLPASLPPGGEALMHVRFQPRWSTGYDRDRGLAGANFVNTFNHPKWLGGAPDSQDFSLNAANSDGDPINGVVPRFTAVPQLAFPGLPLANGQTGALEHIVELNIPNTDVDTYLNWRTGTPPSGPWHPVIGYYGAGDHANGSGSNPLYEFGLLGIARAPRMGIDVVGWPLPGVPAPLIDKVVGTSTFGFGSVLRGNSLTQTLTISAASTGANDNYLDEGLLLLDEDQVWRLSGPASGDYSASLSALDPGLTHALAPGESVVLDVRFAPTANGARNATLTLPSNDANCDPTNVPLSGTGVEPINN